ncbi:MAG: hypothetical protein JST89_14235 [Cyanobacteria bacterium SZAS-4]|nr:hypothetical protein [Cyanobacteria bacterium SZAS-4]
MRSKVLSTLCGIGTCMLVQNGVAADQPVAVASPPVTTTSTSSTTTTTVSPATPRLATTTSAVTTTTTPPDPKAIEDQLHDLVDTLKKTYNAAQSLQAECNRTYNADALDNMIMDPWMEGQPGLAHVQPPFPGALKPLPARRKWVDHDEAEITALLRMLTTEVNAIGPAANIDTSIKVTVEIMQDNMQQVDEQYARLDSLTRPATMDERGQPNYDKVAITKAAQALKDETSGLNEIRKRLLRQLKELSKK